jgi:hypothetical protein
LSKSVVIVGKGPSVMRSSKEFVESFDEVAFCNFPPVDGYEKCIGTHCDWMFANMWDLNLYEDKIVENLGLKHIFNTHIKPCPDGNAFANKFSVGYSHDYGTVVVNEIKTNYNFDPSTGIQAFYFFVKNPEYTTIGLVGFDNFKTGEKGYYYSVSEVQSSLKYLYSGGDTPYTNDGIRRKPTLHGSTEMMKKFIKETSEKYGVTLRKPE